MKGNQGLNALAALCGGASKAGDETNSSTNQQFQQSQSATNSSGNISLQQFAMAMAQHNPGQEDSFNSTNQKANTQNVAPNPQFNQQVTPNLTALLGAGYGQQQFSNGNSADSTNALQLAYLNILQNQASQFIAGGNSTSSVPFVDPSTMALLLGTQQQQQGFNSQLSSSTCSRSDQAFQQIFPNPNPTSTATSDNGAMNPPANLNLQSMSAPGLKSSKVSVSDSQNTSQPARNHQPILMRRPTVGSTESQSDKGNKTSNVERSVETVFEDKKLAKRAANRRSAQLSRKRKKLFIEELKEENDELRKKEQILRSIPDLIVVFDSGGKLWFVSHSVSRFLDFSPIELEGSSFWDRLCDDSVRLLKAAFMDALAARKSDCDTIPLGSGVWELRLQDKDGSHKLVALSGVVHFSGEAPECVCSIRPREASINSLQVITEAQQPVAKPHQSVINKKLNTQHMKQVAGAPGRKPAAQISDADSSTSVISATSD